MARLSNDSRLSSITAPHDNTDLSAMFDTALGELSLQPESDLVDIDVLLLHDFSKEEEEFKILFDLADEAISDPNSESKYVTSGIASGARKVQSADITEQLKKVTKGLELPQFNLSRGGPKLTQHDTEQVMGEPARRVVSAPWRARVKAEMVDLGYEFILAFFATIGLIWFLEPDFREELLAPASMQMMDAICLGSLLFGLFVMNLLLYPFFAGTRSAGQKIFGLEIMTETGRTPKGSRLLLRSLLSPLSSLFAPFRLKGTPLRDRMARTVVAVSEPA